MRLSSCRVLLTGCAVSAMGAVGSTGCGAGCTKTTLTVEPVTSAASGPVTLEARLTAGGDPLPGAGIAFFVEVSAPADRAGRSIGGADTDSDGVATVSFDAGLGSLVLPDETVTGYSAEFRVTGSVDREGDFCRSRGEAQISG